MGKRVAIIFSVIVLTLCGYSFSQSVVESEMPTKPDISVPEAVPQVKADNALMPGYVTVNFKDADIRAVLSYLSDVGGVDIVPAPDVSGTVTLKLRNKPWQTALDLITRNYGLAYEREGDIIRVAGIDTIRMEELVTEVVKLNYATAEDLTEAVMDMVTARGKVSSDARTNVLVITDIPANIYRIKEVLKQLDMKTPQVMIEAKIIETELEKNERMGIDWNLQISVSGASRPTTLPFNAFSSDWGAKSEAIQKFFPVGTTGGLTTTIGTGGATATTSPADFPTSDAIAQAAATRAFPFVDAERFTYGSLDFSQFRAMMEYLKRRKNTEIISNPRITTLNNKEAKIFVGRIYYYLNKLEKDEETKEITYEYKEKEIGVRLLVTPNVNDDGEIVVKLKPEIKHVVGFQQLTTEFSLPVFSTREAETEVMIRHGDTIFIGGLIKEDELKTEKKFPLLGDLLGDFPFIGNVLKYKVDSKLKTELVFFITVYVVKNVRQLAEIAKRGSSSPEVFVQTEEPYVNHKLPIRKTKEAAVESKKPWLDFRKKSK